MEVTVATRAGGVRRAVGGDVSLFVLGDEVWGATSGEQFRLISLVVGAEAVTILVSTDWTETPSVQELESLYQLADGLLSTVRFRDVP